MNEEFTNDEWRGVEYAADWARLADCQSATQQVDNLRYGATGQASNIANLKHSTPNMQRSTSKLPPLRKRKSRRKRKIGPSGGIRPYPTLEK